MRIPLRAQRHFCTVAMADYLARGFREKGKDWMCANFVEPVAGIARIGLLAVHNAMPKATVCGVDFLRK